MPPAGKAYPIYVEVFSNGQLGQFYDVQGTTWTDAPLFANPNQTIRVGNRTYDLRPQPPARQRRQLPAVLCRCGQVQRAPRRFLRLLLPCSPAPLLPGELQGNDRIEA